MLKIDGKDFSRYVNRYGVTESQRRITGPNSGTAIDGSYIEDLVAIKTDVTFSVRPIKGKMLAELMEAIAKPYVMLQYASGMKNKVITMTARPSSSSVELLTHYARNEIFGNAEISFEER